MNPKEIKTILKENGLHLSSKRGQNFLIDPGILTKMCKEMHISSSNCILEIGTGLGALTTHVLAYDARVLSFEIDKGVFQVVSKLLKDHATLTLWHQDFLKVDWQAVEQWANGHKIRVMANLPYSVTSSILLILWQHAACIQDMVVMVQKEVGERIRSLHNVKQFGLLSVILQTSFHVELMRHVPKECFFPAPNVDSVFLKLIPKADDIPDRLKPLYLQMVKWCFLNRRKQLLPRIKQKFSSVPENMSHMIQQKRPENLSLKEWLDLFSFWEKASVLNTTPDTDSSEDIFIRTKDIEDED